MQSLCKALTSDGCEIHFRDYGLLQERRIDVVVGMSQGREVFRGAGAERRGRDRRSVFSLGRHFDHGSATEEGP